MALTYNPPGTVFTGRNECDVLTLFIMEVTCFPKDAVGKFDGEIELVITGGTPPYTIYWTDTQLSAVTYGNYTRVDLGPGSYTAIVTDSFGDFVRTITCTVNGPTPTPSKTPRPTATPNLPVITCENYCLKLVPKPEAACGTLSTIYLTFNVLFFDPQGNMIWVCNSTVTDPPVTGVDFTGYEIRKDTSTGLWRVYDPIGDYNLAQGNPSLPGCDIPGIATQFFQMYGQGGSQPSLVWELDYSPFTSDPRNGIFKDVYDLIVTCGVCPPLTITIRVSVSQPDCEGGGIITILPQGGTGIYEYTINANSGGGIIYQNSNIFYGLVPTTYYVMVRDSSGNTSNIEVVTIPHPVLPQNYDISLSSVSLAYSVVSLAPVGSNYTRYKVQRTYNFFVNITPTIAVGQSITFTLNHNVSSNIKPFIWVSQDAITYDNIYRMGNTSNTVSVYKNGVFVPKTTNLTPQIYSTPTSPPSPYEANCIDTFDLNQGGSRKTSIAATVSPNIPYVNFSSGGTNSWTITMSNPVGTADTVSGTVVTYVEESVFGTVSPTYLNWVTNTQVPKNFLNCEKLDTTDTFTISDITIDLENCSTINNDSFLSFKTDISLARNPLIPPRE